MLLLFDCTQEVSAIEPVVYFSIFPNNFDRPVLVVRVFVLWKQLEKITAVFVALLLGLLAR